MTLADIRADVAAYWPHALFGIVKGFTVFVCAAAIFRGCSRNFEQLDALEREQRRIDRRMDALEQRDG